MRRGNTSHGHYLEKVLLDNVSGRRGNGGVRVTRTSESTLVLGLVLGVVGLLIGFCGTTRGTALALGVVDLLSNLLIILGIRKLILNILQLQVNGRKNNRRCQGGRE